MDQESKYRKATSLLTMEVGSLLTEIKAGLEEGAGALQRRAPASCHRVFKAGRSPNQACKFPSF